jgi:O-acetyl-ADP-ribose deacetylase (regulator of RNase III)
MIITTQGDILLSSAAAIAHGVGPNDHFDSGLALSLREMWPAMYQDFRHYCQTRHPRPGTLWAWAGADRRRIVSLLTQAEAPRAGGHSGRATVEHVNHALRELRKYVEHESLESLALPRLATGVGGLQWSDVEPLVEKHLGDLQTPVFVYTVFHKGVKGEEPTRR